MTALAGIDYYYSTHSSQQLLTVCARQPDPSPLQLHNYQQHQCCQEWSRARLYPYPFCIVINSYLWDFQMMGQVLTLTRRSGLVKIVSLSAECCWIMFLLDSCLLSRSLLFFPLLFSYSLQIIHSLIQPAEPSPRLNLSSPFTPPPPFRLPPPIHLLWGRPPLRVIKRCWRAVMLTNTLII